MGVVSTGGVVGIVSVADEHFSVVIPVLNPKLHISCKLLTGNYYGSLSWDGRDTRYAYLDELPRHAVFKEGDTVVTSGFSAVFPANIMVGTVAKFEKGKDYNFYSLKIKLGTDFWALKSVRVIQNDFHDERTAIEEKARKND
jgi:Cell shape-determining protein